MSTCTAGQLPYKVDYSEADFSGSTPAEACQKNGIAYNGYYAVLNNGTYCEVGWSGSGDGHAILHVCDVAAVDPPTPAASSTTINCTSACTISIEPAGLDSDKVQGDLLVWAACLAFLVSIWAGKQLINLFRTGRYES